MLTNSKNRISAISALSAVKEQIPDSHLINADLAPTKPEDRTWNVWNIASLWVGMSVCIPTYMLAASVSFGVYYFLMSRNVPRTSKVRGT